MNMRDRVSTALKDAMKSKEAERLATLRLINAAMKDRDIALRGTDAEDVGVTEADVLAILGRMVKQRQESARAYEEGGRLDLAERERSEASVIEEFLPRQMDTDETAKAVGAAVEEVGAESIRDMGKVMAALKPQLQGRADMGAVSKMIKAALG